ncbi:MAG: hypothetical protein WA960_21385 [Tunicatimonas sp.]
MNTLTYDQLLEQIHQLPNEEFERLVATLNVALELNTNVEVTQKNIQELLLRAPTWSDQQIEAHQQVRDHINQSRLG